jgi:hypothetical protein
LVCLPAPLPFFLCFPSLPLFCGLLTMATGHPDF